MQQKSSAWFATLYWNNNFFKATIVEWIFEILSYKGFRSRFAPLPLICPWRVSKSILFGLGLCCLATRQEIEIFVNLKKPNDSSGEGDTTTAGTGGGRGSSLQQSLGTNSATSAAGIPHVRATLRGPLWIAKIWTDQR